MSSSTWRKRRMLDQFLALNRRLAKAYLMKERFAHVWDYRSKDGARIFLREWTDDPRWSRSHHCSHGHQDGRVPPRQHR